MALKEEEEDEKDFCNLKNTTGSTNPTVFHPFHRFLPPHYMDKDGIPFSVKWAQQKARHIVALVESLQLTEEMLHQNPHTDSQAATEEGIVNDDEEDLDDDENQGGASEEDDCDDVDKQWLHQPPTVASFVKKCHRIYTQLVALERLKHGGITQMEYCHMVLKVLHLLCATVSYKVQVKDGCREQDEIMKDTTDATRPKAMATLHWDPVGYIYSSNNTHTYENDSSLLSSSRNTDVEMADPVIIEPENRPVIQHFALPSPARESLFNIAIHILDKKSLLRSVSSAGIILPIMDDIRQHVHGIPLEANDDTLLIIHWKALWRLLLRTAPYLDEDRLSEPPMDSSAHESKIFQSTIHLIQCCRRFFDQGLDIKTNIITDKSSEEIWTMFQGDLFKTYSNACFKSSILIYLFHPSRCSADYYRKVLPIWVQIWKSIDRTPTFDYIWITMICRARKYIILPDSFWDSLQTRLLTLLQMWLHIPVGGVSNDKLFPQPPRAAIRSIPSRLKVFTGLESEDETANLLRKVSKLLCVSVFIRKRSGTNDSGTDNNDGETEFHRTKKIVDLFRFVSPYFNPSNSGSWSILLSTFLSCFTYELICHNGIMASQRALQHYPNLTKALNHAEPYREALSWSADDMASLLDALLPLCQQAILSKTEYVRTVAMWSLRRLASMDPVSVCPPVLDFCIRALDVCSLHNAHQTPVALSAITTLFRPLLRYPSFLVKCLPDILRLSLAGIDSNDKGKTVKTLILFANITSWLPIGTYHNTSPNMVKMDGLLSFEDELLTREIWDMSSAIAHTRPESSPLYRVSQQYTDEYYATLSEVGTIMSDWVLEFLDRLFSLFRATGEREKRGNVGHGVASRHSKDDANRSVAFSKVLKESVHQIFASADRQMYESILRSLDGFFDETIPHAAKDVAALCEAVCYVDLDNSQVSCSKMGLDFLVTKFGTKLSNNSLKTNTYRVRLLSGAVRCSGRHILPHIETVSGAIRFSLSSPDKHLFKCGCKLLRHTLHSLTSPYPMASNKRPALTMKPNLQSFDYQWSIPSDNQIAASVELLETHVYQCFQKLRADEPNVDIWRRSLKIIKYAVRGLAGILLEDPVNGVKDPAKYDPHEMAVHNLLASCADGSVRNFRLHVLSSCATLLSLIAKQSVLADSEDIAEKLSSIAALSDRKVCKEVLAICRILYSHRFRYDEDKAVIDVQKDVLNDTPLTYGAIDMRTVLERVTRKKHHALYNDGECSGKVVSNALLSCRLELFRISMELNSSFQQIRRLWQSRTLLSTCAILQKSAVDSGKGSVSIFSFGDPSHPPEAKCLEVHEEIINHLFSLSCHPNVLVRGTSLNVLNHALSRVGWFVNVQRISRLHDALALGDSIQEGFYGLPSCFRLCNVFDQQGRRKQLAETLKGVLLILTLNRPMKIMLSTQEQRFKLMKTICESWRGLYLLPEEDKLKVIAYFNDLFKKSRYRNFKLPRAQKDTVLHECMLQYLIDQITTEVDSRGQQAETAVDVNIVPWKHKLFFAWFILSIVDADDVIEKPDLYSKIWSLCFDLIQRNMAQPIQKLSLGIIGRFVTLLWADHGIKNLDAVPITPTIADHYSINEDRCHALCLALVHNHKEMTGGQEQQLSDCLEEMIRDANNNIAPNTLYPYQRACHLSSHYKIHHVQLVHRIVLLHEETADYFLSYVKVLINSPPSEDQRNQHITSAEIFAGVARSMLVGLLRSPVSAKELETTLVPFIRDIIPKIPLSLVSSYFDALVYAIHKLPYQRYDKLFIMIVEEVEVSLATSDPLVMQPSVIEGFSLQSKWLQLMMSLLNDVDSSELLGTLIRQRLLPCLINSLGHPYEVCRGLIAGCLSRICRRSFHADQELIVLISEQMRCVNVSSGLDLYFHSLLTVRIFLLYCYHREDSNMNYPHLILPLIPALFETVHGENSVEELTPAQRMIQGEVIKTTKLLISDIGTSIVCDDIESITRTLDVVESVSKANVWQIRHGAAHFIRCFHGNHKFIFNTSLQELTLSIICRLLADDRHEVSSAAMAALSGILASSSEAKVCEMVNANVIIAEKSILNRPNRKRGEERKVGDNDQLRLHQQSSVFFLCAAVLSRPYDTPPFIPAALAEISRHSFEGRASPNVRQVVKMVCAEFKRTHMSDNWNTHKKSFSEEQLEALEDVVSAPHYYA